ncbi:hypothetical protein HHI36_008708 [Cryptolaemus montrouzieri]|uniref:Post-GPI attachment to proteins factor 3 n=1 Tax=Cryptolaemus montrouzieri TaxID=559131 RepID=A0ABD2MU22_9CUCU
MNGVVPILLFYSILSITQASLGDRLGSYQNCLNICFNNECRNDGYSYRIYDEIFTISSFIRWPCFEECKYSCMWETVKKLEKENAPIPQFYGKWPFIRFFGIQEPASTFFSLLNLVLHFKWIKIFRKKVANGYPLYWIWHVFAIVCLNAWFCNFNKLLCYGCKIMFEIRKYVLSSYFTVLSSIFINHGLYLYTTKNIDYNYNIILNFSIAILTVICWLIWCFWNRNTQPYVKKCAIYVVCTSLVALLEIFDSPPLFYIFDTHSIWHLCTTFLIGVFYKFAISDCEYLRRQVVKKTSYRNFENYFSVFQVNLMMNPFIVT